MNESPPVLPPPAALDDLRVEPPFVEGLRAEPWRHDFYAVLRRIERSFPERERIGDGAFIGCSGLTALTMPIPRTSNKSCTVR